MAESALVVTVGTDRPRYASGESITLTLTVSNPSQQPATMRFNSAQRYDFRIEDRQGNVLWRWGADQMFAQMMGEQALAAGTSLVYRERFVGSLPPGTYRATGTLLTTGGQLSANLPVTVRP